jgi:hypothetical protein
MKPFFIRSIELLDLSPMADWGKFFTKKKIQIQLNKNNDHYAQLALPPH